MSIDLLSTSVYSPSVFKFDIFFSISSPTVTPLIRHLSLWLPDEDECVSLDYCDIRDRICITNCKVRHIFSVFFIAVSRFTHSYPTPICPLFRWLYIEYISHLFRCCINATIKLEKRLAARKSKFQEELDKIAAQYGVASNELKV